MGEKDEPVILGVITTILHSAPLIPGLGRVAAHRPDLLTPDDILEVERATILHHPFGNRSSGFGSLLY